MLNGPVMPGLGCMMNTNIQDLIVRIRSSFLLWHGLPALENTAKMAMPPRKQLRLNTY